MHKILLIDDEEHILAAMAEYFSMLGYQVTSATNLIAALALLDREHYGIVITDLRLSRCDRDLSGTPFDNLTLFDTIGEGSRCVAFAADRDRRENLVLKVYRPAAIAKHALLYDASIARYEYGRNVALYRVTELRPFIAAPIAFYSMPPVELFLQERVAGESVTSYLRTSSARSCLAILADLRRILRRAHSVGVFNLDLQPCNIIVKLSSDGIARPMLFDFNKMPYHVRPPNAAVSLLLRAGVFGPQSRDYRYWKRLCRLYTRA